MMTTTAITTATSIISYTGPIADVIIIIIMLCIMNRAPFSGFHSNQAGFARALNSKNPDIGHYLTVDGAHPL